MKFGRDRPTGLKEILVRKCERKDGRVLLYLKCNKVYTGESLSVAEETSDSEMSGIPQ